MITDLEVYRAANQLVKRYGEDAEFEAAMRADAMIERGDPEGAGGVEADTKPTKRFFFNGLLSRVAKECSPVAA
jgi:hypothetical protein